MAQRHADSGHLQGKQKQQKRTNTFFEFCNAPSGILVCTDVAARGLDIPKVDWIIQFDAPDDPRDYIHRVGRTARAGKAGRSLLFLLPSELGFLRFLQVAKVPLNEYSFPLSKVANVQGQLEKLISRNYYLHQSAREGYRSYLQAYGSHALKRIFDMHSLDLAKVGKAFGFTVPPKVNLSVGASLKSGPGGKGREIDADDDDEADDDGLDDAAAADAERAKRAKMSRRDYSRPNDDKTGRKGKQLQHASFQRRTQFANGSAPQVRSGGKKGTQWSR